MEYKKEFLDAQKAKGFKKDTLLLRNRGMNKFYDYMLSRKVYKADEVSPALLDEYKSHLFNLISRKYGRKLAIVTIRQYLDVIAKYYKFVSDNNFMLTNPASHLELPYEKRKAPQNVLSEQEIMTLLEIPDLTTDYGIRDRAILEVMYSTGVRQQEVVNLNVYDVDLIEGVIRINQGKGNKDRMLPLGKTAKYYLEKYLKEVRHKWVKEGPVTALFLGKFQERLVCIGTVFKRCFRGSNFPKRVTCHTFRHSCATHMLRAGANIRTVQEMLGHSSIDTTQLYTKVIPLDLKEAHRRCHPRGKTAVNDVNKQGFENKKI